MTVRSLSLIALLSLALDCDGGAERSPQIDASPRLERRAAKAQTRPSPVRGGDGGRRGGDASEERPVKELVVRPLKGFLSRAELITVEASRHPLNAAVAMLPEGYSKGGAASTYPLVIAFGGAGESARPPREGARAWLEFYKVDEAAVALSRGSLRSRDFRGLVTPEQLEAFNGRLKERPYRGVILVCPWAPLIRTATPLDQPAYEAYLMEELLPALVRRYRVSEEEIGVDGVSMGGARAMFFGLKHPERFSSIGAVQGAFGRHMETYSELIEEKAALLRKRRIQLISSDGDPLLPSVRALHELFEENKVPHSFEILKGPHDYIFNQGPGAIALLSFHGSS